MLGLAIDGADRAASAALWRSSVDNGSKAAGGSTVDRESSVGCDIVAQGTLPSDSGKADQLIRVIEQLLSDQGLDYAALDVIAVNRGPGSFTGIRSAVALGRGLALAGRLPVLGITGHEALNARLGGDPAGRPSMIALDARRGEVYAAAFSDGGRLLSEIEARSPAAVAADLAHGRWRLAGHGAPLVAEALDGSAEVEMIDGQVIDAKAVALAAAIRLATGDVPAEGWSLRPLYIRAPDALPPTPLISTGAVPPAPFNSGKHSMGSSA